MRKLKECILTFLTRLNFDRTITIIQAVASVFATGAALVAAYFAWLSIEDARILDAERRAEIRPYFGMADSSFSSQKLHIRFYNVGSSLATAVNYGAWWITISDGHVTSEFAFASSYEVPAGGFNNLNLNMASISQDHFLVIAVKYNDSRIHRVFSQLVFLKVYRESGDKPDSWVLKFADTTEATNLEKMLVSRLTNYRSE